MFEIFKENPYAGIVEKRLEKKFKILLIKSLLWTFLLLPVVFHSGGSQRYFVFAE
jgi:hypothetical protein